MSNCFWSDAINCIDKDIVDQHVDQKVSITPEWGKNFLSEGGNTMNPEPVKNKWWVALLIVAIVAIAAIAVVIAVGGEPEEPVVEKPKESPIGVY